MKYEVGQRATYTKGFSEKEVLEFASISGDKNPIHVNTAYAEKSIFGNRIVHGSLTSSLISTVLGMKLPGEGTIYLSQSLKFLKPVYIGEKITACVEIVEIDSKKRARLKTYAFNENKDTVIEGEAYVKLPYSRYDDGDR